MLWAYPAYPLPRPTSLAAEVNHPSLTPPSPTAAGRIGYYFQFFLRLFCVSVPCGKVSVLTVSFTEYEKAGISPLSGGR